MLKRFTVENFKSFKDSIVFDLESRNNYEFNTDVVKNGIVNKGIIYGFNGCGKSNLGCAIFDIIIMLTDKNTAIDEYYPYRNLNTELSLPVSFEYIFEFDGSELVYKYSKDDVDSLVEEVLEIDGTEYIKYDFFKQDGFVRLKGAENLSINDPDSEISRVKYVRSNSILENTHENKVFKSFIQFVDNMLMFYSLDINRYRGFRSGVSKIVAYIIKQDKTKDFEDFLHENNIDMHIEPAEVNGEMVLYADYKNSKVDFYSVASTGTRALTLFYFWYLQMSKASFVYMDEFDAFYHYELSESIVKRLKKLVDTQIILTTHNTDLLSNDLMRPDCYFWLDGGKIKALSELTEKELRKAHNLQKIFKAGGFR